MRRGGSSRASGCPAPDASPFLPSAAVAAPRPPAAAGAGGSSRRAPGGQRPAEGRGLLCPRSAAPWGTGVRHPFPASAELGEAGKRQGAAGRAARGHTLCPEGSLPYSKSSI